MRRDARVRWTVVALLLATAAGCEVGPADTLAVARRVPLAADSASTLFVDARHRYWLGVPGELVVLDSTGARQRVSLPDGKATPRVIGTMGGWLYARAGRWVVSLDAESAEPRAEREVGGGEVLLDVRGRYLYQALSSGAVFAHDPASLEPVWAWAALGAPATALAAAPEGNHLFLALRSGEEAGTLQLRDIQTGRVLSSAELTAPFLALSAGRGDDLLGLVREGGSTVLVALRPQGGEVGLVWRYVERFGRDVEVALRHAPGGQRAALVAPGQKNGLRVLDAETGESIGSMREGPRDAAFDAGGRLHLLYPGEIRVLR